MKKDKLFLFLIAIICLFILGYLSISALVNIRPIPTETISASGSVSPKITAQPLQGSLDPLTADLETLDTLPGVGPSTAQAFHDYLAQPGNTFYFPEDIMNVKGVGEKKWADILPYITLPALPDDSQSPLFPEE